MNKKLQLITKLVFKISYYIFCYKENLLLKINYLDFDYQNELVFKLVLN